MLGEPLAIRSGHVEMPSALPWERPKLSLIVGTTPPIPTKWSMIGFHMWAVALGITMEMIITARREVVIEPSIIARRKIIIKTCVITRGGIIAETGVTTRRKVSLTSILAVL